MEGALKQKQEMPVAIGEAIVNAFATLNFLNKSHQHRHSAFSAGLSISVYCRGRAASKMSENLGGHRKLCQLLRHPLSGFLER
jgi:hypothetical protein